MAVTGSHDAVGYFRERRGKQAMWAGVFSGPVAWAIQFQISYTLAPFICNHRWLALCSHLVTVVLLVAAVGGGWLAHGHWRQLGGGWPKGGDAGTEGRTRFLSVVGMMTSALFSLLILAQWAASFFLDPCHF